MADISEVPAVELDEGVFKYVLILATDTRTLRVRKLVRGYVGCEYHQDVLEKATQRLGIDCVSLECLGGGRIQHDTASKLVSIYGFSQAFGRAEHAVSADLCRESLGAEYRVTWSNDGY